MGEENPYYNSVRKAVKTFWGTRAAQTKQQAARKVTDQGTRSAVTGGKQMDGFVELLRTLAVKNGVPEGCVLTKSTTLPGFFRPTKDWDLLIITPNKELVAAIEFKSQVGSFGNNFNNRTEEALGNSEDLWTAFREGALQKDFRPWLGYLMVVEKSKKSTAPVRVVEPHYKVFPEFSESSYLDRYDILCSKLIAERKYDSCAVLWTEKKGSTFGDVSENTSIFRFLNRYTQQLKAHADLFK